MTHSAISQDSFLALVGTYTEKDQQGINLVKFNKSNPPEILSVASEIENPSFVISDREGKYVFAVQEDEDGKVTSFKLDTEKQELVKINSISSKGASPCYISLDPSEKFLMVGNYEGGNLAVIPIAENGELLDVVQTIQHSGSSVNEERQEAAHVHSVVFHPDGKQVFVGDLGIDKVKVYNFNQNSETPLQLAFDIDIAPGSGPRHLVFNTSGDRMYLVHELTGEVGLYEKASNSYQHIETYPLTDENFDGEQGGAEIRITKDNSFLYVSNRGDANQVTVFSIQSDGKLDVLQILDVKGKNPRNFNLNPDENQVLVANQDTNEVIIFERDKDSGKLSSSELSISIPMPVYLFPIP